MENERTKLIRKIDSMACFDYNKAIKLISAYLKKNPGDIEVFLMKAHLYDSVSEFHKALEIYNKILVIDSSNIQALIDLGDHYFNCKNDYIKALNYYESALNVLSEPNDGDKQDEFISACIGKTNSLIELDRLNDALSTIEDGIQTYPQDIILISVLQKIRDLQGDA